MVTVKSIPAGVHAVFPMLVCQSPKAEMNFCAAAFGAVEQVRRAGPDGSPIHIAMRISEAFLVVQSEFPDVLPVAHPVQTEAHQSSSSPTWPTSIRPSSVQSRGRTGPHACTESILG